MSAHEGIARALPRTLAYTARSATLAIADSDALGRARVERLVREHHAFVWRSARRLGVREADLDDVVQEVFLAAAKNIASIEHGRERGYLFRTCIYVSSHARRSFQRRREVVDDERVGEELDVRPTPEQAAATSQARMRLQNILEQMPADFRAVFVLFELEAMTMVEIAEALGVPQGTVASRLRRARELFMAHASAGRRDEGEQR